MRYCALAALLTSVLASAQDVRAYRTAHQKEILDSFVQFLSIPNVATDKANISRNAEFIVKEIAQLLTFAHAAHNHGGADVHPVGELAECGIDLNGKLPSLREVTPKLLPALITSNVTKRPRTVSELAQETALSAFPCHAEKTLTTFPRSQALSERSLLPTGC